MRRIPIRIRTLIAIVIVIAFIAGVVFYLKSRPTVALHTLVTLPGYCDHFNEDGSLIVVRDTLAQTSGQSINDTDIGSARLSLPPLPAKISISSDSAFVGASGKGIYDLHSGQLVLALSSDNYWFSPDNRFVATSADGVYELASGKKVIPANGSMQAAFSHDSHYVALIGAGVGDTVYDLTTGQRVFSDPREKGVGSGASFSPDGKYLALDDAVYQVATGKKIAQTSGTVFSSDSALAGTASGVLDLTSGQRILPETMAKDSDTAYSEFSSDGQRAIIHTSESTDASYVMITTVYDIPTRKPLIQIKTPVVLGSSPEPPPAILSPDGQSLAIWQDGVYDVASGKKRFSIDTKTGMEMAYLWPPSFSFNQDSSVLFVPQVGPFDVHTGSLRFGMGILANTSPDGRLISDDQGVIDFATGVRLADGEVNFPQHGNRFSIYSKTKEDCTIVEAIPAG